MSSQDYNQQLLHTYQALSQYPQGGVLVGAGRSGGRMVKGVRHCSAEKRVQSARLGKPVRRCAKYSPGPVGSGQYRSCFSKQVGPKGKERCYQYQVHSKPPQSAKQKRWHAEVKAYAQQNGVSASVAAHALKSY